MRVQNGQLVFIPVDHVQIEGMLSLPDSPKGLILFAHGSGSSRHSPRNQYVAQVLLERGFGTLLLDLLTPEEDRDASRRFEIGLLTQRLLTATVWLRQQALTQQLPLAYFGASTGAAAAVKAAANAGSGIRAVVSRGGRPDMAEPQELARVQCPTLLLVGQNDTEVLQLNRLAASFLHCTNSLRVIAGATHLFEEPGTLEAVAKQAADWFERHLTSEPD